MSLSSAPPHTCGATQAVSTPFALDPDAIAENITPKPSSLIITICTIRPGANSDEATSCGRAATRKSNGALVLGHDVYLDPLSITPAICFSSRQPIFVHDHQP